MTTETGCTLHITSSAVLRDDELFYRKTGVGLFDPTIRDRYSGQVVEVGSEERTIWLPSETFEVASKVKEKPVLLVGELGAGKSAILYGLRARYRDTNQPYCYIDGHFSKTSVQILDKKVDWAVKHNALLTWDSLDYLVGGSKRVRKLPVSTHRERSREIMRILSQYIGDQRPFLGTSHSEPWLAKYGDQVLIENDWKYLISRIVRHDVRGIFEAQSEAIQFYTHAGISNEGAMYLAQTPYDGKIQKAIEQHTPLAEDDQYKMVPESLKRYRLAKLIAVDERSDSLEVRQNLESVIRGQFSETDFLFQLANFVVAKNIETKARMGTNN